MGKKKAVVIGGTGYGGAELIRQLLKHPNISLLRVTSIDEVGRPIGEIHKNLYNMTDLRFEEMPAEKAAEGADLVMLALPHKVSLSVAPKLFPSGVKIVDLSGDYRLKDVQLYKKYYEADHPQTGGVATFTYGLPELFREEISHAKWVASPGCFATSIILSLAPLAKNHLLKGKVRTVAYTGSTGSGAYPKPGTHHPVRHNNMVCYKVLNHQHMPEILQALMEYGSDPFQLDFVPASAPTARGILASSFIDVPGDMTKDKIAKIFEDIYGKCPFIKIIKGRMPETVPVIGTNYVEIGWVLDANPGRDGTRTLVIMTALDNLVKGGAGQAIQSMNLMFGWEETLGLTDIQPWP